MPPERRRDLLVDAIEIAQSQLQTGEPMRPVLITDRWGDRRVEQFDGSALPDAKTRLREFVRMAAGDEECALVYTGRVRDGEDAILIERTEAGRREAEVFVQQFRPKRGRFRGFKLIGNPTPAGTTESIA